MSKNLNSSEIEKVIKNGRRFSSRSFLIFYREIDLGRQGKVAFIAPKRLGNAVLRNRSKRLLRSAESEARKEANSDHIYDFFDIIYMANVFTKDRSADEIQKELLKAYKKIITFTKK